jgi:hypothetical protein
MFLYNTTFSVENKVLKLWQEWMRRSYIPSLCDLLPNVEYEMWEINPLQENSDSINISCQWRCRTPEDLEVINKYSQALLSNLSSEFGDKCLYFSTILRKTDLF